MVSQSEIAKVKKWLKANWDKKYPIRYVYSYCIPKYHDRLFVSHKPVFREHLKLIDVIMFNEIDKLKG